MKCPFCLNYKIGYDRVCKHCKFPFEEPIGYQYEHIEMPVDMLKVGGDLDVAAKLYGDSPEKRMVNFDNKMSWFKKMLNNKPWD